MTELEAGGPSLGNLLGFSLLLREHRALLAVDRRTLAPGVHLVDYEASVPGVSFPLEGPVSARGFRHRRCAVQRMTLEIERHSLQAWLTARLCGRELGGLRVESVGFEPSLRAHVDGAPSPWITLSGRGRSGTVAWFGCAIGLRGDGRRVTLWPVHRWFFGRNAADIDALWQHMAQAIDPRRRTDALAIGIDPALEALRVPFVRAGWKIPALEQLALVELAFDERRARASWRAGAAPWGSSAGAAVEDIVPALADRVRAALAQGDRARACDELATLASATLAQPSAHIAALRWGVEIAATDRVRRASFARARLRLQPTDAAARRALIPALADPEDHDELLRALRLWAQLAESPRRRTRCLMAIAGGLAAKGQFAAAREAVAIEPTDALADEVRRQWPSLLLDEPDAALRAADAAFSELPPRARVGAWCDLADAARHNGDPGCAWQALDRAASPGDPRWRGAAIELLRDAPPPSADALSEPNDARLDALTAAAAQHDDPELAEAVLRVRPAPDPGAREPHDVAEWLATIDDAFDRGALDEAVSWCRRMLDALPMGPDAYVATASRGIHAALAHGDLDAATELLDAAIARAPEHDAVARARDEILAATHDPQLRARLLAAIAQRYSGPARVEALEERARLLAEVLGAPDEAAADLAAAFAEAPDRLDIAARLADAHAERGRWQDAVQLLARVFARQRGEARRATLLRMAAAYRDHLADFSRAEQALRLAIATLDDDDPDHDVLGDELAALLERQGRWVDLGHELGARLADELAGTVIATPPRVALLLRLARLQREVFADDEAAALSYEALDRAGALPDEGLACLAHAWRRAARYEDLVRLLDARARVLVHDPIRFAAARLRAAELLDGPLARPLDAVDRYLDAYLVDPKSAAARLRVLLVGVVPLEAARARLLARIDAVPEGAQRPLWTLLASVLSHHPEHTDAAAACYREAIARDETDAAANEGLARLELRRGDVEAAWPHVCVAVRHGDLPPSVRAELAATAARALLRAGSEGSARALLELALEAAPDHVPALLELARVHERAGDLTALGVVLDHLRTLPMSAAMRAEVLHRHAASLQAAYREDPRGDAAELAIADVLEALRADPTHPGARQLLLEIARLRGEWSLVVAGLEAVLRTLGPGPARARVELEIGELCSSSGHDDDAATRRLEAALCEIDDDDVHARIVTLALRLRPRGLVATRIAQAGTGSTHALGPEARARLDRLVARLREGDGRVDVEADDPAVECTRLEHEAAALPPGSAAQGWLAVAATTWQRLGDGERAARALLHALALPHDEAKAARLIADVAFACGEDTATEIYDRLRARGEDRIGPDLRLQRASLARLLGRDAEALDDLAQLTAIDDGAIRRRALAELDQILAQHGTPEQRVGVLRARLAELSRQDDGEFADVAAELARLELELGNPTRALATCRLGLRVGPQHRTLLRLHVELLELHELPDDLAVALRRYAMVCASPRERARHLVRAARIVLDRGANARDTAGRQQAADRAAELLAAAREADDDDVPARALALPLAFAAGRSDEIEALGRWLWTRGRRDEPSLLLAAIHEARRRGTLELATSMGQRDAATILQTVLPAVRQAATEIATTGPAEHIDAVLAAAARLAGGPLALFDALRRWASDRPLQAGLALALSRMHDAHGDPVLARRLLQLAAFLAPRGPLEATLVPPAPGRDEDPEHEDETGQLGGHSAMRALLRASVAQRTDAWTNVVPDDVSMPADERRFREMHAHVGRFTGLAGLLAGDDGDLVDRIDALATLANPDHRTTGRGAERQAEALARRRAVVPLATRIAALDEIAHWLSSPEQVARLRVELQRHWWLVATRKSQELRGALRALAEAVGTRRGADVDAAATLRSDEARWLLRTLDLYAS